MSKSKYMNLFLFLFLFLLIATITLYSGPSAYSVCKRVGATVFSATLPHRNAKLVSSSPPYAFAYPHTELPSINPRTTF